VAPRRLNRSGSAVKGLRAVFLDRDGVILVNRPGYTRSVGEMQVIPGAIEAIVRLHRAGLPVAIVTNQSAIGRGLATRPDVDAVNARIADLVARAGGRIAHIAVCPHLPDAGCGCRKPLPGLILEAAVAMGVDPGTGAVVGDQMTDIEAARAVGADAYLVGGLTPPRRQAGLRVFPSLAAAAVDICERRGASWSERVETDASRRDALG